MKRGLRTEFIARRAFDLCLILGALSCAPVDARVHTSPLRQSVIDALGDARPFPFRLGGDDPYGPCGAGVSSGRPPARCASLSGSAIDALAGVAPPVADAMRAGHDVDASRAAALLDLLAPTGTASLDRAIERLDHAASDSAGWLNAALLNDRAVAYGVRALSRGSALDLVRAFESADAAVALDSTLPSALFNRALLLDLLMLDHEAAAAWIRFVEVDSRGGWADDARARIDALRRRIASFAPTPDSTIPPGFAGLLRDQVVSRLLADWAYATPDTRDAVLDSVLPRLDSLDKAFTAPGSDQTVPRMIARMHDARSNPALMAALHDGYLAYAEGRRLYGGTKFDSAAPALARASRELRRVGSPFAEWASIYEVAIGLDHDRYAEAGRTFAEIADRVPADSFPAIVALARRGIGIVDGRRGRLEAAVAEYGRAADLYERAHEAGNEAQMRLLEAEARFILGDAPRAVDRLTEGMLTLRDRPGGISHAALLVAGSEIARLGFPLTGLAFHTEALAVAERGGQAQNVVQALDRLARSTVRLGRTEAADRYLAQARDRLPDIEDLQLRERHRAELAEATAIRLIGVEDERALAAIDSAVEFFDASGISDRRIAAHIQRARIRESLGDAEAAQKDLADAVRLFEGASASVRDFAFRFDYYGTMKLAFDGLATYDLDAGRPMKALATLERSRQAFLSSAPGPVPDEASLREVAHRIPQGTLVLAYGALGDAVVVWALARDTIVEIPIDATPARIGQLVTLMRNRSLPDEHDPRGSAAEELYTMLIGPVSRMTRSISRLVIVPDGPLGQVPFAALRDPRSKTWLIQQYVIELTPSLALLSKRAAGARGPGASALIVSNPAFDRDIHADLADLPAAEGEADNIAGLYSNLKVLNGNQATVSAFLAAAPRYRVVHFAGHGILRNDRPDRSSLVLAPSRERPEGVVHAADLATLDLSRVDLLVLSACSSVGGVATRTSGLAGLAQAALVAGAGGVIGSLWEVDDRRTAELMITLHQNLAAGQPPAVALSQAQMRAARLAAESPGSDLDWAAFVFVGRADF